MMRNPIQHAVACGRRRRLVFGLLAVVVFAAYAPPARAQAQPGEGTGQAVTPEEMLNRALDKIETGDFSEARGLIENVRRLDPTLPRLRLAVGLMLIEEGRHYEALPVLSEYNTTDEGKLDYRGFGAAGELYHKSKAYRQAVIPLERAKDLAPIEKDGEPVRAKIAIRLAETLNMLKRHAEALAAAKEAASLAPNDPAVLLGLAKISRDNNDIAGALDSLDRALNLISDQLRVDPFNRQKLGTRREVLELQRDLYKFQVISNPSDGLAIYNLARSRRRLAEAERDIGVFEAMELTKQAILTDPRKFEWQVYAAELEVAMGAEQDARERLQKVLQENPGNPDASRLLDQLNRAPGTDVRSSL